jgi:hypothetical protein
MAVMMGSSSTTTMRAAGGWDGAAARFPTALSTVDLLMVLTGRLAALEAR